MMQRDYAARNTTTVLSLCEEDEHVIPMCTYTSHACHIVLSAADLRCVMLLQNKDSQLNLLYVAYICCSRASTSMLSADVSSTKQIQLGVFVLQQHPEECNAPF